MTLLHEPEQVGFLVRVWRVYREKRNPFCPICAAKGIKYRHRHAVVSRRDALSIAWEQALWARGVK